MAFINEYTPKEDFQKYDFEELDNSVGNAVRPRQWTIDRERKIFLRQMSNGREEFLRDEAWIFFWQGNLLWIELEVLDGGGDIKGHVWATKLIIKLCVWDGGSNHLSPELAAQKAQILADLKEAFDAYSDGGVYSEATSCDVTLQLAQGV